MSTPETPPHQTETSWQLLREIEGEFQRYDYLNFSREILFQALAHAGKIEVAADEIFRILTRLGISNVEIRSGRLSKKTQPTPSTLPNKDGSTTRSISIAGEKTPPVTAYRFDYIAKRYIITIDTNALDEKSSQKARRNEPQFYELYSAELNVALTGILISIAKNERLSSSHGSETMFNEMMALEGVPLILGIFVVVSALYGAIRLSEQDASALISYWPEISISIILIVWFSYLIWSLGIILSTAHTIYSDPQKRRVSDFYNSMLAQFDNEPKNFRSLLFPFLHAYLVVSIARLRQNTPEFFRPARSKE